MHNGSEHMIFHQLNQLASTTRSNQHYQQPTGTNPGLRDKNWIQEMNQGLRGDGAGEDVDGDWPPPDERSVGDDDGDASRREVSPAEQLCQSPRLVPPRFRLVAAESRPESLLMIFLRTKDFIQQKMGTGGLPGGPRGRGHASHPRGQGVGPLWYFLRSIFFLFPKITFVEFQDFWSCAEQVSNICSFSSPEFQLPAFSLLM